MLPWLARLCLKREKLYFPRIGYLFVLYFAWALIVSLINAESLYLSIVELCREGLYFLSFVYLINNVTTRTEFRSALLAVFLGLIVGAGSVIIFFEEGIGTNAVAFVSLHDPSNKPETRTSDNPTLTLHNKDSGPGPQINKDDDQGSEIKRSQGIFRHPGIPASLSALILPIVFAYLLTARSNRDRILFLIVLAWGFIGLLLTFSRAGLVGLMGGTVVFFLLAGWSGLIARRVFTIGAVTMTLTAVVSMPLLLVYFESRPGTFVMRYYMAEAGLQGYGKHPILGVGLNNSTAAMKEGRQALIDTGIRMPPTEPADSYYLAILMEVGPVGFVLFFGFFGEIVTIALRAIRESPIETKPLLVGIVAGLASLATQSISDEPLAGHAIRAMLWLFCALIVALARHIQAERQASPVAGHAPPQPYHSLGQSPGRHPLDLTVHP
jgi:hypothetical protein